MEFAAELFDQYQDIQNNWEYKPLATWMSRHVEVPIFACGVYLWMVHCVSKYDYNPMKLRAFFALWNFFLATFSMVGAAYVVPVLFEYLTDPNKGLKYSICQDPGTTFYNGPSGFWIALFILSKFPEMLDTFFLVVQRKPVIFLHWYHHTTVALYCWHAYINNTSGLWFAAMNFSVHAVMYSYYFFMAINMKGLVRPLAPFITTFQIAQMVVGLFITMGHMAFAEDVPTPTGCSVIPSNAKLGFVMYLSYFILFAQLFYNSYVKKGGKHSRKAASPTDKKEEVADAVSTDVKKSSNLSTKILNAGKKMH